MHIYRGFLDRYVELYNAGDLDGVMDLYADDSSQLMPDGTFEGRSAIRDRLARELTAFSDLAHRVVSYVEDGDSFADEWVFVAPTPVRSYSPTAPRCLRRADASRCRAWSSYGSGTA